MGRNFARGGCCWFWACLVLTGLCLPLTGNVQGEPTIVDATHQLALQRGYEVSSLADGTRNPDEIQAIVQEKYRTGDSGQNWEYEEKQAGRDKLPVVYPTYRDATNAHQGQQVRPDLPKDQSDMATPERVSSITVFFNTLLMALASGLGAVPFFFVRTMSKELIGIANAVACGVMLAASFDLIHEGEPYGPILVVVGIFLGMLFVKASGEFLEKYEDVRFESLEGAGARKTLLIVGIMAAHAIGEGSGVGVSYSGTRGWAQGMLVTLAIGLHNIPEGLAVATVMVARGVNTRQALLWSILTSLPQTVFAVPSYWFVEAFTACLPVAMGFAAGSMIWVVFSELVPDALENANSGKVAAAATLSAAWLECLRMLLKGLEQPGGTLASPIQADSHVFATTFFALLPVCSVTITACFFTMTYLFPRPGVLGASVGMQAMLGILLVLGEIVGGTLSMEGALVWALLGGGIAFGFWKSMQGGSEKIKKDADLSDSSTVGALSQPNSNIDPPDELPITSKPSLKLYTPMPGMSTWFSLANLGAYAVLLGLKMASGGVDHTTDMGSVIVPASLSGVLVGVIGGSLLLTLPMKRNAHLLASTLIGCIPLCTAVIALLRYPLGTASSSQIPFDPSNLIGKLTAILGGCLITGSVLITWPAIKSTYPGGPRIGAILGCTLCALVQGTIWMLCLSTPYCLG